jgi:hypothetical protein
VQAIEREARGAQGTGGQSEFFRKGAGSIPAEVSIAYHDIGRDYLTGIQRAASGEPSLRSDFKALPAVLSAGTAKSLAEHRLASLWAGRQFGVLHLPWRRSGIRAGAHLRVEGMTGLWRAVRWTLGRRVVSLDIMRVPPRLVTEGALATPGTPVTEPDIIPGATTLLLFDLPMMGDGVAERPILVAAAAGASAGWRGASLLCSYNRGASWHSEGNTRGTAVVGRSLTKLEARGSALMDAESIVEVELLNDAMWLEGRSDDALAAGDNLAVLGRELLQFGHAEPLGNGRFRLSRFLRGRRGTEAASSAHAIGEPFLLLDRQSIAVIEPAVASAGGEYWMAAQGVGDQEAPVLAKTPIEARALMPPSPVHLRAERLLSGDLAVEWVRRSRNGWNWLGGSDAPLAEESEAYLVRVRGDVFERLSRLGQARFTYTAAQQAEDGFPQAFQIEVKQIGTHGFSAPTRLQISY